MSEKDQQIMRAAEKLFTARRYDEVKLDDVAQTAGVGKGTIYRYFDNKEALYFRTLMFGLEELVERMEAMSQGKTDGAATLPELAATQVEFFSEHRSLFALLHSEELRKAKRERNLRPRWRERKQTIRDIYVRTIQRGIESGRYRADTDPELTAAFLMGMLRSGGRQLKGRTHDLADQAVRIIERGICSEG